MKKPKSKPRSGRSAREKAAKRKAASAGASAAPPAVSAPPVPKGPFCQSCGMPMDSREKFGTNADGSLCADWCVFCFQKGSFTRPQATLSEMTELVAGVMSQKMGLRLEEARAQASAFLPGLKRWRH